MNTLVVLADSGTFKAFSLKDKLNSTPRLQPLDIEKMQQGDNRIGQMMTDQAGQFRKGTGPFAPNTTANRTISGSRMNVGA